MRKLYAKQTCSFFLTCYNYSIIDSKVNNANFYYQVIKILPLPGAKGGKESHMIETHYECPCLEKCPLNYAMSIIGGKWKMQIICSLNNKGTMRYNELRRKLDGISNTVLASSLKELEEEGLVERREYLEVPIRVEYSSTEMCDRLMPILEQLSDWGEEMMKKSSGVMSSEK